MRPDLIISGGQTGADQAGWKAAKRFGIATGGWMTSGFVTEGPGGKGWVEHPEFHELYGVLPCGSDRFPDRTRLNVEYSDATLLFEAHEVRSFRSGTNLTANLCCQVKKPVLKFLVANKQVMHCCLPGSPQPVAVALAVDYLTTVDWSVWNVAGPRESSYWGIGQLAEECLCGILNRL